MIAVAMPQADLFLRKTAYLYLARDVIYNTPLSYKNNNLAGKGLNIFILAQGLQPQNN